jgi:hypothetical protein
VKATNAIISCIRENSFEGLKDLFSQLEKAVDIPDAASQSAYLDSLFNKDEIKDGFYSTTLEGVMQTKNIGEQLHAVFLSSVYQKSFMEEFDRLIGGKEFSKDKIDNFNTLYLVLDSSTGLRDGATNNYFRLPHYTGDTDHNTSDYYVMVTQSLYEKFYNSVYEMVKSKGYVDDATAGTFASNLIHMFSQVEQ